METPTASPTLTQTDATALQALARAMGAEAVAQPKEQLQFFVYIVESPSAVDIYQGRSEGHLLQTALRLDRIPAVTRTAISLDAFRAALYIGLLEEMKDHPTMIPILHVSAHGGEDGLQLADETIITWAQLRSLLLPLNKVLGQAMLICMSSCSGYSACRMEMGEAEGEDSFLAIIGHVGTPMWSDTAIAYSTFYHLLAKGRPIGEAVDAMSVASGDTGFRLITSSEARQTYLEYISNVNLAEARQELQEVAEQEPIPPEAKRLEEPSAAG